MSRIARIIFRELIYGGHLCSLGASCAVYAATQMASVGVSWQFLAICYLGTESVYLADHCSGVETDVVGNPDRSAYLLKRKLVNRLLTVLYPLITLWLVLQKHSPAVSVFAVCLLMLGLGYGALFKGLSRHIPAFKDVFGAVVWAALIPFAAVYEHSTWSLALSLATLFVLFRLLVDIAGFDVKDIGEDSARNIRTLAVLLGQSRCVRLLQWLNLVPGIVLAIGIVLGLFSPQSVGLFLYLPYNYLYLKVSARKDPPSWLFDIVGDGEPVTWCLFLWLGQRLL